MSINRVTLEGFLGDDPRVSALQSGSKAMQLSVATSERWKDKNSGEDREHTEWHRVVIYSDWMVEALEKVLKKGSRVVIEGSLRTREWEKDGVKRYATEIIVRGGASMVYPVNLPKRDGAPLPEDHRASRSASTTTGRTASDVVRGTGRPADLDDDIPF